MMNPRSNVETSFRSEPPADEVSYLSDWRVAESVGTAVVLSVADYLDRRPMTLPSLSTAVDPDALDQLLDDCGETVAISFSYAGCELSLKSNGKLTIC